MGPRSDCSFRSSLIWVHTVCRYAKNSFEKFARIFSRPHKQTTFSDAVFLGALRVNVSKNTWTSGKQCRPIIRCQILSTPFAQGPVFQSTISLTSLLITNLLTVVAKVFSNALIFFGCKKCMQLLQCERYSNFFQQKISMYLIISH